MMRQMDVNRVRNAVVSNTGRRVKVKRNKGRHKVDIREGIISETYPNIFVIETLERHDMPAQIISYSYTDVLTKDVELILCR